MPVKVEPSDHAYRAQVAALPTRSGLGGTLEVLLISSRETRRWIIPKGWPMKGRKDHEAAAQEALEEAGVAGKVRKHPIGAYTYQKRLNDRMQPCRVMVYRLDVEKQLKAWPEKDQRERRWFPAAEAAELVTEAGPRLDDPQARQAAIRPALRIDARNARRPQRVLTPHPAPIDTRPYQPNDCPLERFDRTTMDGRFRPEWDETCSP